MSCQKNNSNNQTKRKIELPSQELVEQRKKEFNEFRDMLVSQLNKENKLIAIREHLSSEFKYYVGKYIPNKKELKISIDDDNALDKLSSHIDMNKVKEVLKKGYILTIGAHIAALHYKNEAFPIIDFTYDENSSSWEIDVIRYETE